jgi:hypothetical protein
MLLPIFLEVDLQDNHDNRYDNTLKASDK